LSPPPDPPPLDSARFQVVIRLRYRVLPALEAALEPLADVLLSEAVVEDHPLENRPDDEWRLLAIVPNRPAAAHLADEARRVLADSGQPTDGIAIEPVPALDWIAHVERDAPPIALGRFLISAAHHEVDPRGRVALRIEAGLAFGSGRHATTQGCLRLIERAARRGLAVRHALDLGAGSGILAIAIAQLWRRPVIAADIDPLSVAASRVAARVNHVGSLIRAIQSRGIASRAVANGGPYDLICANILAGPLIALAPRLRRALAPRGVLVLSGILVRQEAAVLAAYRGQGLALKRRLIDGDWTTLALARGPRRLGWP
jgi:ribosomal protein L11 methyltransferase